MNSFTKTMLTGAGLALGGMAAAIAVGYLTKGRVGQVNLPVAPGMEPVPVNTFSSFPMNPWMFG